MSVLTPEHHFGESFIRFNSNGSILSDEPELDDLDELANDKLFIPGTPLKKCPPLACSNTSDDR